MDKAEKARFRAQILEALPSLVVVVDGQGRVVEVNGRCAAALGGERQALLGADFITSIVSDQHRRGLSATLDRARAGEQPKPRVARSELSRRR